MTVNVTKSSFNVREKLKELERPIGVKGNELMRAETLQDARDLVSAGRKNIIINGDFQVSQRATSATSISSDTYHTVDRWKFVANSSGTFTLSKESDAPPGFSNSLKYLCTTADASPNYLVCRQNIEGYNLQQLGYGTSSAKHITFSFWVKSNVTGTYSLALVNVDASTKGNSLFYTINSPGVWEYKTLTYNPDTSAGFDNDNDLSMEVSWWLGASSTYNGGSSTNGNWTTLDNPKRAGSAQIGTAVNNYWQIAGVQMEVGKNATEFEHRSYGEELALCQRYCYVIAQDGNSPYDRYTLISLGHSYSTANIYGAVYLPVPMRIPPSFQNLGNNSTPLRWSDWSGSSASGLTINEMYAWNNLHGRIRLDKTSGFTAQRVGIIWFDGSLTGQKIAFNAEL